MLWHAKTQADLEDDWVKVGKLIFGDRSIKSDSGVGESNFGTFYEKSFKKIDSKIYKELKLIHEKE